VGAATLVKAVVLGESTMRFDPDRTDDTIDLTLGSAFERLATATELNQTLVELGEPTAPPQCATAPSPAPSR
ncbi:MAG: LytR family transcriptional regulator, partial [Actinoplanes sp.]